MSVWEKVYAHDRQFTRVHEALTILTKTCHTLIEEVDRLRKEVDELKGASDGEA